MSLRVSQSDFGARPLRTILVHIAVVAVFGVFLPWWLGYQFLDPVTIAAYCCLGVMFAAPAAAQAFADSRPQSMRDALKRIAIAAIYGEGMALVILIAGMMTAYFRSRALFVLDLAALSSRSAWGIGFASTGIDRSDHWHAAVERTPRGWRYASFFWGS